MPQSISLRKMAVNHLVEMVNANAITFPASGDWGKVQRVTLCRPPLGRLPKRYSRRKRKAIRARHCSIIFHATMKLQTT